MLFNKTTGKLCGIIEADPLEEQHRVCVSWRPLRKTYSADDYNNRHWFCTPWEELLADVVCPD